MVRVAASPLVDAISHPLNLGRFGISGPDAYADAQLDLMAEAMAEGLWLQVSAVLLELGVLGGEHRLLVLGDGAAWIRTWFAGLGIPSKAMILCWWHLRKRCYESMSSAGGPKDRRRAFEKELLGAVVEGRRGDRDPTSGGGLGVGEEPGLGRGVDRVP